MRSIASVTSKVALVASMVVFVVLFNRLLWRRLYVFGERKLRFD